MNYTNEHNSQKKKKRKKKALYGIYCHKQNIFLYSIYTYLLLIKKMHYFDRYLKINIKYNYVFY